MPFIPAPRTLKVEHLFGMPSNSRLAAIIQHVQCTLPGPYSTPDLQTLVGDIATSFSSNVMVDLDNSVNRATTILTDISTSTGAQVQALGPTPGGHAGGGVISSETAIVASFPISSRYRGGHPRSYIPGASADRVGGPGAVVWTAGFLAAIDADLNGYVTQVASFATPSTGGITLAAVRWTYTVSVDPVTGKRRRIRTGYLGTFPISAANIQTRVCTQRRRLGRLGADV